MKRTIVDIAHYLNLPYKGNGKHIIDSIAPIDSARVNQLSFVVSKKYLNDLKTSAAGVVIVPPELLEYAPGSVITSVDPYSSYAKVSHFLYPPSSCNAGIHASAVVHPDAEIASSASIKANVVIDKDVSIGEGCVIGPGCVIGSGVVLGSESVLFANVTLYHDCRVGKHCRVQSGTVIGGEGFGYASTKNGWLRINQIGTVVIGNRVEIGANTTIDRGAIGDTVIEDGVILDNQIQIAHNVHIGCNTAIAGCTGIAGSTIIGKECTIAGAVSIVGHLNIVDNVHITANSLVLKSITEPGKYSSGMPLQTNGKWRRTLVRLTQLEAIVAKLNKL